MYTPNFAHWRGINDRFHMLAPKAAMVWKRRRFFAAHMCKHFPIHSEVYTHAFANATGLAYSPIEDFGFVRIRSTGEVAEMDAEFPALCGAPVDEELIESVRVKLESRWKAKKRAEANEAAKAVKVGN